MPPAQSSIGNLLFSWKDCQMLTYRKFWKKCEELGISKTQLMRHYGIGHKSVDSLKKDESVSMRTIQRLCDILNCDMTEIVECYPNTNSSSID